MARFLVGLTGGLASGKSLLAAWLAEGGVRMVDADALVAELYRTGEPGAEAVRRLFGAGVLAPDGSVDHGLLAARVFDDPAARRRLEAAIHPLVRERFRQLAAATEGIAGLEATLLVEAGYAPDFDLVVSVEADRRLRAERAAGRGLSPQEVEARLAAQGDGALRRRAADWIVRNDGDLEALRREAERLLAEIRRRAGAPGAPGTAP